MQRTQEEKMNIHCIIGIGIVITLVLWLVCLSGYLRGIIKGTAKNFATRDLDLKEKGKKGEQLRTDINKRITAVNNRVTSYANLLKRCVDLVNRNHKGYLEDRTQFNKDLDDAGDKKFEQKSRIDKSFEEICEIQRACKRSLTILRKREAKERAEALRKVKAKNKRILAARKRAETKAKKTKERTIKITNRQTTVPRSKITAAVKAVKK